MSESKRKFVELYNDEEGNFDKMSYFKAVDERIRTTRIYRWLSIDIKERMDKEIKDIKETVEKKPDDPLNTEITIEWCKSESSKAHDEMTLWVRFPSRGAAGQTVTKDQFEEFGDQMLRSAVLVVEAWFGRHMLFYRRRELPNASYSGYKVTVDWKETVMF